MSGNNKDQLEKSVKLLLDKSLLNTNAVIIADTNLHPAADGVLLNGYAIYALEDSTFSSGTVFSGLRTSAGADGTATLITKTLKAGHVWYIGVSKVKLASGSVIVYKQ